MANSTLDKTISVNGKFYDVTAVTADTASTAEKVANTLTITTVTGDNKEKLAEVKFDGSEEQSIEIAVDGGNANSAEEIQVILIQGTNDPQKESATITISNNDPNNTNRDLGDIWFKYN